MRELIEEHIHALHARLGAAGQVNDERFAADDRRRPAEHGSRGDAQACRADGLRDPGCIPLRDCACGLGRDVAWGKARAARGQNQVEPALVPGGSAAAAILEESATPRVDLGGEPFLLNWPQLEGKVQTILTLLNDEAAAARLIAAPAEGASVLLGEDMEPRIPGLSVVSCRYLVGGGLYGSVALVGPTRMPFSKVIPLLEAFADELGEGMAGKRKDAPQAAPYRGRP